MSDPYTLLAEIRSIIIDVTGCSTDGGTSYSWTHHPGPCTPDELDVIAVRVVNLLRSQMAQRDSEPVAQADGCGQ